MVVVVCGMERVRARAARRAITFGASVSTTTTQTLAALTTISAQEFARKWNFDPILGVPLPGGRYVWSTNPPSTASPSTSSILQCRRSSVLTAANDEATTATPLFKHPTGTPSVQKKKKCIIDQTKTTTTQPQPKEQVPPKEQPQQQHILPLPPAASLQPSTASSSTIIPPSGEMRECGRRGATAGDTKNTGVGGEVVVVCATTPSTSTSSSTPPPSTSSSSSSSSSLRQTSITEYGRPRKRQSSDHLSHQHLNPCKKRLISSTSCLHHHHHHHQPQVPSSSPSKSSTSPSTLPSLHPASTSPSSPSSSTSSTAQSLHPPPQHKKVMVQLRA